MVIFARIEKNHLAAMEKALIARCIAAENHIFTNCSFQQPQILRRIGILTQPDFIHLKIVQDRVEARHVVMMSMS